LITENPPINPISATKPFRQFSAVFLVSASCVLIRPDHASSSAVLALVGSPLAGFN
jgi:hypothetical protein